jgi:hypothetical protein
METPGPAALYDQKGCSWQFWTDEWEPERQGSLAMVVSQPSSDLGEYTRGKRRRWVRSDG